jgi:hypothetical protein
VSASHAEFSCFTQSTLVDADEDDPTIRMKPQPESSTQEVLAGLVGRVTFHNAENGFCVLRAKVRGHRELVTVVGHAARRRWSKLGEWLRPRAPVSRQVGMAG